MITRLKAALVSTVAVGAALVGLTQFGSARILDQESFDAVYADPAPSVDGPLRVFHLGHSLVGRDMPAMLAQLAGDGHAYESQLGWGANMKAHWEPDVQINGFDQENAHPRYRDAKEAVASAEYDAIVLTEMVEIKDAIAYFDSPRYLRRWTDAAWAGNPQARVYFYESWHELDDEDGWLDRIDRDLALYWEGEILRSALAEDDARRPIYVIPAGQVMARFVRAVEDQGGVGNVTDRTDLFKDKIHPNDLGMYLVALTHYAALYQRSPVGLPHELLRANGEPADAPSADVAAMMQEVVWDVVQNYAPAGLP